MALVNELLKQVNDDSLRAILGREVESLKERITFGLVFEKHIPETTLVTEAGLRAGSVLQRRDKRGDAREFVVEN